MVCMSNKNPIKKSELIKLSLRDSRRKSVKYGLTVIITRSNAVYCIISIVKACGEPPWFLVCFGWFNGKLDISLVAEKKKKKILAMLMAVQSGETQWVNKYLLTQVRNNVKEMWIVFNVYTPSWHHCISAVRWSCSRGIRSPWQMKEEGWGGVMPLLDQPKPRFIPVGETTAKPGSSCRLPGIYILDTSLKLTTAHLFGELQSFFSILCKQYHYSNILPSAFHFGHPAFWRSLCFSSTVPKVSSVHHLPPAWSIELVDNDVNSSRTHWTYSTTVGS